MLTLTVGATIAFLMLATLVAGCCLMDWIGGLLIRRRFRRQFPDKVALLAYSQNEKWDLYIREALLPRLGDTCLAVDRSNAQWKDQFPVAAQIVAHWGGWKRHNPLAVVFPGHGKPVVFRLYEPFLEHGKGRSTALQTAIQSLEDAIRDAPRVRTA